MKINLSAAWTPDSGFAGSSRLSTAPEAFHQMLRNMENSVMSEVSKGLVPGTQALKTLATSISTPRSQVSPSAFVKGLQTLETKSQPSNVTGGVMTCTSARVPSIHDSTPSEILSSITTTYLPCEVQRPQAEPELEVTQRTHSASASIRGDVPEQVLSPLRVTVMMGEAGVSIAMRVNSNDKQQLQETALAALRQLGLSAVPVVINGQSHTSGGNRGD